MKLLLVIMSGVLFGLGLSISGMINPTIVLGFLDVAGDWNPALIFVMVGALLITTLGYPLVFKRKVPLFGTQFHLPVKKHLDARLITGAACFGVGWGMSGYCPGPAISGLVFFQQETLIFVFFMMVGFQVSYLLQTRSSGKQGVMVQDD